MYGPSGFTGGYSELKLSKNSYEVHVNGNGWTSQETVRVYLLRRCAELTQQAGYKYFLITSENPSVRESSSSTTTMHPVNGGGFVAYSSIKTIHKYRDSAYIMMFNEGEQPIGANDAEVVLENFKNTKHYH